jgi:2-phospho-L-lactate/phosphoenolpyruvate guanylyltransferase
VRIVLIAAKELGLAKTRLATALPSVSERALLAEAMFRDVLDAALSARRADRVAVVTSDGKLKELARSIGAMVLNEDYPRGLNVAVRLATRNLLTIGATCVCTLLSDIPLITGDDVDAAFAAMPEQERAVVLVPSRDFSGTNMIVRRPPDVIATEFGRLSLVRHLDACRHSGISCQILRLERPALDLDLPADLQEFERTQSVTHTLAYLAQINMLHQ